MVKRPKVLVVYEDKKTLFQLRLELLKLGYDVELQENPLNAKEHLRKENYDLVLSDGLFLDYNERERNYFLEECKQRNIPTFLTSKKAINVPYGVVLLKPKLQDIIQALVKKAQPVARKKTVLLIDDSKKTADIYRKDFEAKGYDVIYSDNTWDAKQLVDSLDLFAVVTDLVGLGKIETLVKASLEKGLETIILTAGGFKERIPQLDGLKVVFKEGDYNLYLKQVLAELDSVRLKQEQQKGMQLRQSKRPKILFIDDDSLIIDSYKRLFIENGYDVVTCANIDYARQLLSLKRFDLILTDNFYYPEFIRFLKDYVNKIPIVIWSAAEYDELPRIPGIKIVGKVEDFDVVEETVKSALQEFEIFKQQKKVRVLLVDDNLFGVQKDVVKENLEASGPFEVVCIDNHFDASRLLDKDKFDMIVSDILVGDEDIALRFLKKAIQMNILITLHSSADYHDILKLRRLVEKYDLGFFQKNGESDDLAEYLLERLEQHKKKWVQKQELREEEMRELQKLMKPISHVETGKGTPEELRALVLEARELDAQLRTHVVGNNEMPRRELEIKFAKLQEIKARIREYVKNRTIQRQTVLKDGTTYRDRYWNSLTKRQRYQENLQDTSMVHRITSLKPRPFVLGKSKQRFKKPILK